ncbi:MAG: hypothetical protein JSR85_06630 [Proteobacteria bacterium]|nr:hypothetical protein [Pseudomonadota bacterium]
MTVLPRDSDKPEEGVIAPSSPISIPDQPYEHKSYLSAKDQNVAVIRKELVALTGDPLIAVVLNQLLYWTQRLKDFELQVEEEQRIDDNSDDSSFSPHYGWFYKTAHELIEETMTRVTRVTMRRYLRFLIERGWITERRNFQNKWDKTTHYRVNLRKLESDLQALGYTIPGFPQAMFLSHGSECLLESHKGKNQENFSTFKSHPSNVEKQKQKVTFDETTSQNPQICATFKNNTGESQNSPFDGEPNTHSNVKKCNFLYLTETTSETTNKEHTARAQENAIEVWKKNVGGEIIRLSDERKQRLQFLLDRYFQDDLSEWEGFCERVKSSSFLMGEGTRRWRVTLDWILEEANLLKVLEGNFDDHDAMESKKNETNQQVRDEKLKAILDSIKDPLWKDWCSQLEFSPHSQESISLRDLQGIANACFLEVENSRLVWIGSHDPETLDHIDRLRLKIFPVIEKTFPNTRTLRTRLIEEAAFFQQRTFPHSSSTTTNNPQKGESIAQ